MKAGCSVAYALLDVVIMTRSRKGLIVPTDIFLMAGMLLGWNFLLFKLPCHFRGCWFSYCAFALPDFFIVSMEYCSVLGVLSIFFTFICYKCAFMPPGQFAWQVLPVAALGACDCGNPMIFACKCCIYISTVIGHVYHLQMNV